MSDKQAKQTTFSLSGGAKVKDEDYYQSKNASLFKSCNGLRFSEVQDYDTFLEKNFSILNISGFVQPNGVDLLIDSDTADGAIYDCIAFVHCLVSRR